MAKINISIVIGCLLFLEGVAPLNASDQKINQPHSIWAETIWAKPLTAGSLLVGSLALMELDESVITIYLPHVRSNRTYNSLDVKDLGRSGTFFEQLGSGIGIVGVSGSFYLTGLLTGSQSAARVGILTLEASILTGASVLVIKGVVGRTRPVSQAIDERDPDQLKLLSSNHSFPSGHAATAFAMARVISSEYQSFWVSFLSYGLAGVVGAGRIVQEKHWASDVIAGAALGWGMGSLVTSYEKKTGKSRSLYIRPGGIGIQRMFTPCLKA